MTVVAFAVLTVAVLLAVRAANTGGAARDRAAGAEANRLGRIVQTQDQAPRSASLRGPTAPRLALERAISADMRRRIARHQLSGPLHRARCYRAAGSGRIRRAYRCTVRAGDVPYPFLGVVDLRSRRVTWCKYDPGPTAGSDVPVSPRCRG